VRENFALDTGRTYLAGRGREASPLGGGEDLTSEHADSRERKAEEQGCETIDLRSGGELSCIRFLDFEVFRRSNGSGSPGLLLVNLNRQSQ
jgi:hypothetical protein